MQNSKQILLLVPPSSFAAVEFPYPAIPILSGQLLSSGFNTICRDFNIELFNEVNNEEYIVSTFDKYNRISDLSFFNKDSIVYKKAFLKNKLASSMYNSLLSQVNSSIHSTNYYNMLYDFIQIPYTFFRKYADNNFSTIKYISNDRKSNFFLDYFNDKISHFPDDLLFIGISCSPGFDIYPLFTLSRLLKLKYPNTKIVLGGYLYSPIIESIKKNPEIFDLFCDYILIGDGENSIVEFAKFANGEIFLSSVSNVVYRDKSNKVVVNSKLSKVNINKIAFANYDDYNLDNYSNDKKLSMSLSKGCYWGKCRFCSYSKSRSYQIKTIQNVLDEIKFLINKYHIDEIHCFDDAIKPDYYYRLSNLIIENKINIKMFSFAIFDEGFTYDVLKTCKQAGLEKLTWGFETASKKVFDYISKSGCFDKREEILKNSHEIGIYNVVNFIEGLPGENLEDLILTVKFLYDNIDYIDAIGFQKFQLRMGSYISENAEMYGIEILGRDDFSLEYNFINHNTGINSQNSFVDFLGHCENTLNLKPAGKEFYKIVCEQYLKKFAPNLL